MMAPGTAFADRVSSHRLPGGARLAVMVNPWTSLAQMFLEPLPHGA